MDIQSGPEKHFHSYLDNPPNKPLDFNKSLLGWSSVRLIKKGIDLRSKARIIVDTIADHWARKHRNRAEPDLQTVCCIPLCGTTLFASFSGRRTGSLRVLHSL
jgi:hypothetical protein